MTNTENRKKLVEVKHLKQYFGSKKNVVKAMQMARNTGMHTIAFTGEGGGKLAELCDITLAVPSTVTARIQEMHILVGHIICELIEEGY